MNTDILYDYKWHKLLRRSWLFRYFPFVDFALVAGSMALGDVHENSDFDIIIGTKYGRLYTARFFCLAIYKIFNWRRRKISKFRYVNTSKDSFCFNHFVTEKSYCLQPPYNLYWRELYTNLAPIFGDKKSIENFFQLNAGLRKGLNSRIKSLTETIIVEDLRFKYKNFSVFKIFLEKTLSGKIGDWAEKVAKKYQLKKIEQSFKKFPPGYKPRLIYDDKEVELHLDTSRTESYTRA